MLDIISTSISSISLLIQLYDRHGVEKVRDLKEYKIGLRDLVSSLHFSKSMHAAAHDIMDSRCTDIFDANIMSLGVHDFCQAYRANLGRIYEGLMTSQISPNIDKYESLILGSSINLKTKSFTNQFKISVGSLSQSYPRMIDTYKNLESAISDLDDGISLLSSDVSKFYEFSQNFDQNKGSWKSFIDHNNRRLLTLADQTILNQITILDELFLI